MNSNGNVFGSLITTETLTRMPAYRGKQVSKRDRAQVAIVYKNLENRDTLARQRAEVLKRNVAASVSTICLVYNATGDTIKYSSSKDWDGSSSGSEWPQVIENGQWGVLVHVNTPTSSGSKAAVAYRGKNVNGDEHDWILAWDNPCNDICYDKVYTEVREVKSSSGDIWDGAKDNMNNMNAPVAHHQHETKDCISTVTIGNYNSPMFEALFVVS